MRLQDRRVLAFLALVVLASGCTQGGQGVTVSQTEGVVIESFSATPAEVFGGQLTNLELQLRNKGGQDATGVKAKLFNVPIKSKSGSGSQVWSLRTGKQTASIGELRAPDPDTDTPAVTTPNTWTLKAPNLDQGVTIPYDFFVRVFYKYNTRGVTNIQVMSSKRFQEEGATRTKPSIDVTGGPIQMEVRTRTPIIFFEGTGNKGARKSDLCVIVRNEGSGTPYWFKSPVSSATDQGNVDKVQLRIDAKGERVSVSGSKTRRVSLVGSKGVGCFTLESNFNPSQDIQATVPITLTANYGYYIDSQTSVTVNGRRRGDTTGDGGGTTDGGGGESGGPPTPGG